MITICNKAVADTASEILGKERCRGKPSVIRDVLDLHERENLKKRRYEEDEAKEYRKANKRDQKA